MEMNEIIKQVKTNGLTDIVFKGEWFDEYVSLFRMIENGETKVTRIFLNFDEDDIGEYPKFRQALFAMFRSPLSTVELLDFSKIRRTGLIDYCFTELMEIMSDRKRNPINPNVYVRTEYPKLKGNLKMKRLRDFQNDHRVQLVLLVLASGKKWKRGTQKSAMKKFPEDLIRLTATFII
jgi:hypothetical protein